MEHIPKFRFRISPSDAKITIPNSSLLTPSSDSQFPLQPRNSGYEYPLRTPKFRFPVLPSTFEIPVSNIPNFPFTFEIPIPNFPFLPQVPIPNISFNPRNTCYEFPLRTLKFRFRISPSNR
jgi:hypothetical protein